MSVGTLVNVLGASRSGSTMLDLMLGNDGDAFSCGEAYSWFRPWRTHHFTLNCACGDNPCAVWQRLKGLPEAQFHSEIVRQLNVKFVIDSAKDLNWFLDAISWARRHQMAVSNVLIWKEPINLAYSYWKRSGSVIAWRKHFVTYHRHLLGLGVPFVSVRYEDLAANPRQCLRELCQALGMRYFEGKERFWEKRHHYLFGSLGTRKQVEASASEIRSTVDLDPKFSLEVDFVRQQWSADIAVQQVVVALNERRLGTPQGLRFARADNCLPGKKPAWYYMNAARSVIRRRFPEKSAPHFR